MWLLVAGALYGLAYLFYRGSVVVARQYGIAIAVVVDLNRFTLYDRLNVDLPADSEAERQQNRALGKLLNFDASAFVAYRRRSAVASATPEAPGR